MTDREKLIEILDSSFEEQYGKRGILTAHHTADHLLANGVTVQKWIPVTERLPENSDDVIVCYRNGWVTKNAWLGSDWWHKSEVNPITHWMPLPEAPKGE